VGDVAAALLGAAHAARNDHALVVRVARADIGAGDADAAAVSRLCHTDTKSLGAGDDVAVDVDDAGNIRKIDARVDRAKLVANLVLEAAETAFQAAHADADVEGDGRFDRI